MFLSIGIRYLGSEITGGLRMIQTGFTSCFSLEVLFSPRLFGLSERKDPDLLLPLGCQGRLLGRY